MINRDRIKIVEFDKEDHNSAPAEPLGQSRPLGEKRAIRLSEFGEDRIADHRDRVLPARGSMKILEFDGEVKVTNRPAERPAQTRPKAAAMKILEFDQETTSDSPEKPRRKDGLKIIEFD